MQEKNLTGEIDMVKKAIEIVATETEIQKIEVRRARKQNNTVYMACKITDKSRNNQYKVLCKIIDFRYLNKDYFAYEMYDEKNVPEDLWHCPSSVLKLLSPFPDENSKEFRETSRDILSMLAAEKSQPDSLTNLPVDTQIVLVGKKATSGCDIILQKMYDKERGRCYWEDVYTHRIYRKQEIQSYGYEVY
jgi:hypothetical protein